MDKILGLGLESSFRLNYIKILNFDYFLYEDEGDRRHSFFMTLYTVMQALVCYAVLF
jgi:hypothetical protein